MVIGALIGFGASYFSKKGENLATKQDIDEITTVVEGIRAEVKLYQMAESEKRQLKHKALVNALSMIDAHFSHTLTKNVPSPPTKQYATIEEARACHSELILTVDNPEIIKLFLDIMIPDPGDKTPPTDMLNEFRNMIRMELNYGESIQLDREHSWISSIGFDK